MFRNSVRCFIIADKEEFFNFDNFIKDKKVIIKNNQSFYYLNEKNILVISGIGKVNASLTTMNAISNFDIKDIINVGVCGSCDSNTSFDQVILVDSFYYLDVDVKEFGYQYGQIPKTNEFFSSSFILDEFIFRILFNNNYLNIKKLNIGTSDSFINEKKFNNINDFFKNKISLLDMESTAIAQVCWLNHIKFSSIKIISDIINVNKKENKIQYNDNLNVCSKEISNIINILIKNNF